MGSKLRIKVGAVEVEYETDQDLPLADVETLMHFVEGISSGIASPGEQSQNRGEPLRSGNAQGLFVTSIAAKLGVKSGAELARAAAAQLQITDQKDRFTRRELLETMKKATRFYKSTMSKNLSGIIASLIPDTFNQIGEGVYALTAAEHAALERALADA